MAKAVEFYFDYASPYAYVANEVLEKKLPGAEILYRPTYLRGLEMFREAPPFTPRKMVYMAKDLARVTRREGIPHRQPSVFPVNGIHGLRGALWCQGNAPEVFRAYHRALFRATWAEDRNVSDRGVVVEIAAGLGIDEDAFLAGIGAPELKEQLKQHTAAAEAQGIFGVPSFVVDDELYWGHDRMDYVREALEGRG
jgi:2-hydroxychromene-2-carboxylate isomerase